MGQVPEMQPHSYGQYTQVKISIRPELAAAFKTACAANNESMTGVISGFMETYSSANAVTKGYLPNFSTKRQRRAAVRRILAQLELIRDNEENYIGNIPDNLQTSEVYLFAEYCVDLLDEAIEALETAYIVH
jgi:hypothetical protein